MNPSASHPIGNVHRSLGVSLREDAQQCHSESAWPWVAIVHGSFSNMAHEHQGLYLDRGLDDAL